MRTVHQRILLASLTLAMSSSIASPPAPPNIEPTIAHTTVTATQPSLVRLNFRQVPLEMVLDYLAEAAGFTILLEVQPKGTVDVWSEQPLCPDEALNLLDSVLIKNGYAAIRDGRKITIVDRDEAKTRSIPVKVGAEPANIPRTAQIVTQVIPVRFVQVSQLVKDLQPLLSTQATLTANESANTIILTDTQINIRHVTQLISALDAGAEDVTLVKVFGLKNADPTETADLLAELFPAPSSSPGSQSPIQVGGTGPAGPGGLGFGPPGGPMFGSEASGDGASSAASSQNQRLSKRATVTAVADPRTGSLVVSASRALMPQVQRVIAQLDSNPAGRQKVAVHHLKSVQAQQLAKVLQDLFQKNSALNSRNTTAQTDPLETRLTNQTQRQSSSSNSGAGFGGNSGGLPSQSGPSGISPQ